MKRKLTLWQMLALVAASVPILYFSVPAIYGLLFGSPMFTLNSVEQHAVAVVYEDDEESNTARQPSG